MRIFQRGAKGIYSVEFCVNGERVLKSLKTTDKKTAEQEAQKIYASYSADSFTLMDALQSIFNDRWRHQLAGESYRKTVLLVINYLGDKELKDLTSSDIARYIDYARQNVTARTINSRLTYLKAMLRYANEVGKYPDPIKIKLLPEKKTKTKFLTSEEEERIYSILFNYKPIVADYFKLLLNTGVRRKELLEITGKDFRGNYLDIYCSKTDEYRSLPLNNTAREILTRITTGVKRNEKIFKISLALVAKAWQLYVQTQMPEMRGYGWHLTRHTAASRLVQADVSIPKVQALLGHKSVTTTMRYAHLKNKDLEEIVKILDGKLDVNVHNIES